MNNLFSNIFKKREKVIIPLQEEIENLEFLLRIKENNSNIRDEKEYIDLLTYYSYVNIHGVFELEYHYSNNYRDTCGLD